MPWLKSNQIGEKNLKRLLIELEALYSPSTEPLETVLQDLSKFIENELKIKQ